MFHCARLVHGEGHPARLPSRTWRRLPPHNAHHSVCQTVKALPITDLWCLLPPQPSSPRRLLTSPRSVLGRSDGFPVANPGRPQRRRCEFYSTRNLFAALAPSRRLCHSQVQDRANGSCFRHSQTIRSIDQPTRSDTNGSHLDAYGQDDILAAYGSDKSRGNSPVKARAPAPQASADNGLSLIHI